MAADTVKLAQGSDTLDINDGTIYSIKRIFLSTPADKDLWHVPDYGESQLVRAEPSDRPCTIDMAITGADEDTIQNYVVTLRRWLMNEAKRAAIDGDTDSVYLTILKDGGTNTVKHRIKNAYVDDSASHYTQFRKATIALHVTIHLVLAPYGEWDTTITLQNDLFSSPHFVEDSASDGLADGWAVVGTPTTTDIRTNRYLIGGSSQRVITNDADSEGITTDTAGTDILCAQHSDIIAYAWVYHDGAGVDPITVQLNDGAGTLIEAKELSAGDGGSVSDKTAADAVDGTVKWYRVVVSGSNTGAANAKLLIYRAAGDATQNSQFWVDGCYMDTDATAAPDAWMSAKNIDNRGDVGDGAGAPTQAQENQLNYWDVWGVPGDAPALIKTKVNWTTTAANANVMHVGKIADGALLAADEIYWVDDNALSTGIAVNAAYSQPGDASRTEARYRRLTDDGSADGSGPFIVTFTDDDARSFSHNPKRIMFLCQTSALDTDIVCKVYASSASSYLYESGNINLANTGQWTYLDMGTIQFKDFLPLDVDDPTNQSITLYIAPHINTAAATFDIDAVLLLPTEEDVILVCPPSIDFNPNTVNTYIDGRYQHVVNSDAPIAMSRQGTLWTVEPGNTMTRYIWAIQEAASGGTLEGNHDPTIATALLLSIWPRTRHLLGT